MTSTHPALRRLGLLAAALVLAVPAAAAAQSVTWEWKSGICGAQFGGLLEDQTFPVAPNTVVSVVPPSYDMQFGPRVYVGVYIDGHYFPQTSSPDERQRTVTGPTVTVGSSTLCSADPARRPGVIRFTAPAPPPAAWDWSYSYTNPSTPHAQQYIVQASNAVLFFENPVWFWQPIVGAGTFTATTPARITYRFPFPQPVAEARLRLSMPTFHWSYSRGHNRLFGSRDGVTWIQLMDVPPPAFGGANGGFFNALLPPSLLGGTELWLRADLYSFGPLAHLGGFATNTAQHARYDVNLDNTPFALDVNLTTPCPVAWDVHEEGIGNATARVRRHVGPECGDVSVAVDSTAYANGSAIDPTTMESIGLAHGTVLFTVDRPRALVLNVSIGGVMGGSGLFESTARIEGRVTEDGIPVATFVGPTGAGIDEVITLRPIPLGYKEVTASESRPYMAFPGRQYALEFSHRLSARASLSTSSAFANFAGSTGLTIDITPIDLLPQADAGPDQAVAPGTIVTLDGTASSDPDGLALDYRWTQVGGDLVDLSDPASAMAIFEALAPGLYRFELVVDNGTRASPPDYVNVLVVDNRPPVAEGDEATAVEGATVAIDVLANDTDPDGDPLSIVSATQGEFGSVAIVDDAIAYAADVFGTLIERIEALPLGDGLIHSLRVKVVNARDSFERGQATAGLNQLGALVNQLEGLVQAGQLDADLAGGIIALVQLIQQGELTDSFEYTIADPGGLTATATVIVTIRF